MLQGPSRSKELKQDLGWARDIAFFCKLRKIHSFKQITISKEYLWAWMPLWLSLPEYLLESVQIFQKVCTPIGGTQAHCCGLTIRKLEWRDEQVLVQATELMLTLWLRGEDSLHFPCETG